MIFRQKLYDKLFGDKNLPTSTTNLYIKFLQKLPDNSRILDVGVGTGVYFENPDCISLIQHKGLKIHGIDIAEKDIILASKKVEKSGLSHLVKVEHRNIFSINSFSDYNVIIFSESYPVINHILMKSIINHIVSVSSYKGLLQFINNVEDNPNWVQRSTKHLLKYITFGTDFGRVVSTKDMLHMFESAGILPKEVHFEMLASATPNYALFRNKIKLPGLNFEMKQYLVSIRL